MTKLYLEVIPINKKNKLKTLFIGILLIIFLSILIIQKNLKKPIKISKEDLIEDIEYIDEILQENFIYYNYTEERAGFLWEKEKKDLLKRLNRDNYAIEEVYNILGEYLSVSKSIGHISIMSEEMFRLMEEFYYQELENKSEGTDSIIYDFLKNDKVKNTYHYLSKKELSNNWSGSLTDLITEDNVSCEILSSDFAYVKIKSLLIQNQEYDSKKLFEFYELVEKQGIKNLIVDVTYNTGGTDLYWQENIVVPLINNDIEYNMDFKTKNSELVNTYMDYLDFKKIDSNNNFNYYQIEKNLLKNTKNYYKIDNIYLYIDNNIFSATSNFLYFSMKTSFATTIGRKENIFFEPGINSMRVSLPNSNLVIVFDINDCFDERYEGFKQPGIYPEICINSSIITPEKLIESIENNIN